MSCRARLGVPMRILVVHNRYRQRGGEDVVAESEVTLLRSRGHDVLLYEKGNEDVHGLSGAANAMWSRRTRREISKVIGEFRPEVAHVHNVFHAISPAVYGMLASHGVPVVQTLHNFRLFCIRGTFERGAEICERCVGASPWRGVALKCYRDSYAASGLLAASLQLHRTLGTFRSAINRYVVLNEFCRRKFIECGIPREKIVVKPNFIDVPDPGREGARAGGLFVGRMVAEKGIDVLARALELAPGECTVIGDGPLADVLRRTAGVGFLGSVTRNEVIGRMREAAYLIMPSVWYETFGLVMIEAFASRLPVIASNMGAMADLIEDGKTGLLFEAGSPVDLARKLSWANAHPEEMRRMGDAARARYEHSFTSDRNYDMLLDLYKRVMADAGPVESDPA